MKKERISRRLLVFNEFVKRVPSQENINMCKGRHRDFYEGIG
jgi:hypothetical protein